MRSIDAIRSVTREITPQMADFTVKHVYGEVWQRPGLSKRDRSLITIAALMVMGRGEQLSHHMGLGLDNGVTKDEISELIFHLAFYGGWPTASDAVFVAKEVFDSK